MLRQLGQLREQIGPRQGVLFVPGAVQTGAALPELSGVDAIKQHAAQWEDYLGDGLNLIVLLTAHCATCQFVAEHLAGLARDVEGEATVLAIVETREGHIEEALTFIGESRLDPRMVVVDEGGKTAQRLGVGWSPAVVTASGRRLGEAAIINSASQLNALVHARVEEHVMA